MFTNPAGHVTAILEIRSGKNRQAIVNAPPSWFVASGALSGRSGLIATLRAEQTYTDIQSDYLQNHQHGSAAWTSNNRAVWARHRRYFHPPSRLRRLQQVTR